MTEKTNGNGRGTVQKLWDIMVDPGDGVLSQLARVTERLLILEARISKHHEKHLEVHKQIQEDLGEFKRERERRRGGWALIKNTWAAVLAFAALAVSVLSFLLRGK